MGYRKILLLLNFLCIAAIRVWAQTPSCSIASKFYSKDSIQITTFGASTVAGVNGFSFQPYLKQNFEYCYTGKTVIVSNYGIPGETTTQGVARFQEAITGKSGFVCILMGVNDVFAIFPPNTPANPTPAVVNKALATAQSNMENMIKKALNNNLVVIVGTVQYITNKTNRALIPINADIMRLNAGYERLVKKYQGKVYLADINAALGHEVDLFQADGLHPNAQGDKIISYVWFDAINNAIEESTLLLVGLNQNYPNPASSDTKIGFSLTQSGKVDMELYNMTGASVKTITNQFYNAGFQEISVSVSDLKPGIYVYVMRIAGRELAKKMIVVR